MKNISLKLALTAVLVVAGFVIVANTQPAKAAPAPLADIWGFVNNVGPNSLTIVNSSNASIPVTVPTSTTVSINKQPASIGALKNGLNGVVRGVWTSNYSGFIASSIDVSGTDVWGFVNNVSGAGFTIVNLNGSTVISVSSSTQVTINKLPATLSDLKNGLNGVVRGVWTNNNTSGVTASSIDVSGTDVWGFVNNVSPTGFSIVNSNNVSTVITVSSSTTVTVNKLPAALSALKNGLNGVVRGVWTNNNTTGVTASSIDVSEAMVWGSISNLTANGFTLNSNGQQIPITANSSTLVTINKQTYPLSSLQNGMSGSVAGPWANNSYGGVVAEKITMVGTAAPATAGSVTISLAAGSSPSAAIPLGASHIPFVKFAVTNTTAAAATITQVTVKRIPAGPSYPLTNIYLYNGAVRLTPGRSINFSTQEAIFSGLNIVVPANSSLTLDVLADISFTEGAGRISQLSVSSVMLGSIAATGTATGNTMTLTAVSAGTITVAKAGSITNPKTGQQNAKVASFTLSASSAEDLTVKRISLYKAGGIPSSNFSNFKLVQGGNTVSTVLALDDKNHVNFDMNFVLAKGDTKTFEVYIDISPATYTGSPQNIKFYLEESADLYAVGNTYGFGSAVVRTTYDGGACTSTSGDCSYSYVENGKLTITFNGPPAKDIAKNDKDVEVLNFTMLADNNLEVRQILLSVEGSAADLFNGTEPNFTDIKIVDTATNQIVWGPTDVDQGPNGTFSSTFALLVFVDDLNLAAGQPKTFKVTMDVANNSDVNTNENIRFRIEYDGFVSSDVRNIDNNTYLTALDIFPDGDIVGNTMTVKSIANAGILTLANAGSSASDGTDVRIVNAGQTGVTLGKVNFTAQTEDLKLTKIRVNVLSTNSAGSASIADDINYVYLYDGNTLLAGPASVQASGTSEAYADFSVIGLAAGASADFIVTKDNTKSLTVKADLNTISNGADSGDEFAIQVASTNFEARSVVGSTLLTSYSGSYTGQYMVLRKSQPKVEVVPLTSSALSDGTVALFRFKVTAQNGDVALKHITFTSSTTTGVTLSAFAIREQGGANINIVGSNLTYAAGSVKFNATFTSQEVITSSNFKIYEVVATVGGADTGDSVSTSIAATDTAVITGFLTSGPAAAQTLTDDDDALNVGNDSSAASAAYNFIWSDMSAIPHNDTVTTSGSHDWTNGRNVKILPTDAQGLSFN